MSQSTLSFIPLHSSSSSSSSSINNHQVSEPLPGLYYVENYLSRSEMKEIVERLTSPEHMDAWKPISNYKDARTVQHYGYIYAYDRSGVTKTIDIPLHYMNLVTPERIAQSTQSKFQLNPEEPIQQLIINKYKPGQGILPHIDHTVYFGDVIVCLTVGSGCEIEFTPQQQQQQQQQSNHATKVIYVKPGSLYIMSGDARYKYKHGIKAKTTDQNGLIKRDIRYSLTYRHVKQV